MTKEEIEKQIKEGFIEMKPKIGDMANILMEFYIRGFKACWRILTGKELEL
ncbi:MAG: hypothetical protein K6F72_00220 [Bacteroidales bacterium]|nr:hypothetical protein [Bacteroidales bacterium]